MGFDDDQIAKELYELSKQPGFDVLAAFIDRFFVSYYSDPPKTANDAPAFTTFSYALFFGRKLTTELQASIKFGERLSNPSEDISDDAEELRRRERAGRVPWSTEPPRQ